MQKCFAEYGGGETLSLAMSACTFHTIPRLYRPGWTASYQAIGCPPGINPDALKAC